MGTIRGFVIALLLVATAAAGLSGCGAAGNGAGGGSASEGTPGADGTQGANGSQGAEGTPGAEGAPKAAEPVERVELTVSAAASLALPMEEIRVRYEERAPHVALRINYGSSGTLQKQIEQGAQVDVFVSAGRAQMEALVEAGLIAPQLHATLLTNRLVVVVPADRDAIPETLHDLENDAWRTIAIGEPDTVPAGTYAREALESAGVWDAVRGKAVFGKDARHVLTAVATGAADAGFVYATDAAGAGNADDVRVAFELPPGSHQAVEYPAGVVAGSGQVREAEAFYRYLFEDEADGIFRSHGFGLPPEEGR